MSEQLQVASTDSTPTQDVQAFNLLDSIIDQGRLARDPEGKARARDLIGELVAQVLEGSMVVQKDIETTINARIAQIDKLISDQLNEVMHAPEFQRLEASWRGFHHLVHQTETSTTLKIRVMNASKKDLLKDLQRAAEFDQSILFKKIYEAEYGMFGGEPFGILVGDYQFDHSPQDVELLEKISNVAGAAHAPFISSASPEMLNMDSFANLDAPRDLAKLFTGVDYIPWNAFRESEDSRYVALVAPHYLCRLPYGRRTVPVDQFDFEEDVDGRDHSRYLWGNAAYLYATRVTDAFARYGWCTAIRGVEGGGLVENLPAHTFQTDDGELAVKCPTEVAITERREKELSDLGFISLVHCKGTNYAAFFGAQTSNRPKKYVEDAATANAELSARLPYLMATSRIAHYLKAIVRDKVGGFATKDTIQRYLERWIAQYILLDDSATPAQKAKKPLREAKILVEEVPGQPGVYRAVAHLRPHFQLEAMAISLRLVATLPPSAK